MSSRRILVAQKSLSNSSTLGFNSLRNSLNISRLVHTLHSVLLHFSRSLISMISRAFTSPSLSSSIWNRSRKRCLHSSREGRQSSSPLLGLSMSSKNFSQSFTCHQRLNEPLTTHRFLTVPTSIYLPNSRQYAAPVHTINVKMESFKTDLTKPHVRNVL